MTASKLATSKTAFRVGSVVLLLVALTGLAFHGQQGTHLTAYFEQFKGIYVGDDVTVRGVPVGRVTAVEPQRDTVKVELEVDEDVHLPADVRAAVVAQSVVSVRSIVLGPVGGDGPPLEDGAVIPQSRTAIPVEWDDVKNQLVELATVLGPKGANAKGATSELVSAGAKFLEGQGGSLNSTIRDMSEAMSTLSDNRGDLFATVRNLQVFITALKGSDTQVRLFNRRLATVAASLNADRRSLTGALTGLDRAFKDVNTFVKSNREVALATLRELRSTTSLLAQNRQNVADLLQVAPTGMSNFYNIVDPRGTNGPLITGALAANNLQAPAQIICGALLAMGGDRVACQEAIGPLARYFAMGHPPVGAPGLVPGNAGPNGARRSGTADTGGARTRAPGVDDVLGMLLEGLR